MNRILALGAVLAFFATACTKTEITPYPEPTNSRLLTYEIVNAQDTIHGAVNEDKKTITVYLPTGAALNLLEPRITVSAGATVTPESGTFIENMMDYFNTGREIKYTVTGADKSTSTYTLNIISLQGAFAFDEVSNAANPLTFNHSISWYYPDNAIMLHPKEPYFFGQNSVLKAWLVAEDGTEIAFNSVTGADYVLVHLQNINGYYTDYKTPAAGLYKIKIQYYSKTYTLQNPIKLEYL